MVPGFFGVMKLLALQITDVSLRCQPVTNDPDLCLSREEILRRELHAIQLHKLALTIRNVRLTESGYFKRRTKRKLPKGFNALLVEPLECWRRRYQILIKKLFPEAWVYSGGHHLAVHEARSGPLAGPLLFAVVEISAPSGAAPNPAGLAV